MSSNSVPAAEDLFEAGRFDEALSAFEKLAAADSTGLGVRARIAACLIALGRHAEALAVLEPLVAASPDQPLLGFRLAVARAGSGDLTGALDALDAAASAGLRAASGVDTEPSLDRLRARARYVVIRERI